MPLRLHCARCGRVEDPDAGVRILTWHLDPGSETRAVDLCCACSEPLDALYDEAEHQDRGHARGKEVLRTLPMDTPQDHEK
jgi:hypothetical protein